MDNYYDPSTQEWVTDFTRYTEVLDEPRFAPIRNFDSINWPAERAWKLLVELLEAVPSDTVALVGAGPIESFVKQHGAAFIEPILAGLAHNDRLREAIINVNIERGSLPAAIEARFQEAAGPSFQFVEPTSPDES